MVDLKKYVKQIEENVKKEVNSELFDLFWDVLQKSPVDKWNYIKWHKVQKAEKQKDLIIWEIFNQSEEASNVEFGWRSTAVNWHKNRKKWWPIIFTWVGARVYTRVFEENKDRILKKFKNISLINKKW